MTEEKVEVEKVNAIPEWILEENEKLDKEKCFEGEKLESLHFEEDKIVQFTINFKEKFREWENKEFNITNAIIPVEHKGEKKHLWLNKKNPLYRQLVTAGRNGITEFKVIQVGNQKNTRYKIIKD